MSGSRSEGGDSDGDGFAGRPIVLLGADGMLGRAWQRLLAFERLRYLAPGRGEIDLAAAESLLGATPHHALVINCAAWTDVDSAESHEREAYAVNGVGPGLLADECARVGATLVHYSTDYVFDGRADAPYPIHAPRRPLGAYGRSKAEGEVRIESSGADHLIVRTSWLYAPWGRSFVRTIAGLAVERDELRVVDDQRGRPTDAGHLARTTLALLRTGDRGIRHVCDGGECSWYELACHVVGHVNPSCRVTPCGSTEYPRPAARPSYSVLDLSETERRLGPMPEWRSNVSAALAAMPERVGASG